MTASVSYRLADGVEQLRLTGADTIDGFGNHVSNTIVGNVGDNLIDGAAGSDTLFGGDGADRVRGGDDGDVVDGGLGNDILTGGSGNDVFAFTTTPDAGNRDRIVDFTAGQDTFLLDGGIFATAGSLTGVLDARAFVLGDRGLDADDRILYDAATGRVFYDGDGVSGDRAVLFAIVTANTDLHASDFTFPAV